MSTGSCASSPSELLPGDEPAVTALSDLREGQGQYTIIVSADALSQIDGLRKNNNDAVVVGTSRGTSRRTAGASGS
jgi:hypothetical protein